jgi:hypothetical protein
LKRRLIALACAAIAALAVVSTASAEPVKVFATDEQQAAARFEVTYNGQPATLDVFAFRTIGKLLPPNTPPPPGYESFRIDVVEAWLEQNAIVVYCTGELPPEALFLNALVRKATLRASLTCPPDFGAPFPFHQPFPLAVDLTWTTQATGFERSVSGNIASLTADRPAAASGIITMHEPDYGSVTQTVTSLPNAEGFARTRFFRMYVLERLQ